MADVQGIINLNKPVGITSVKALYAVRKVVGQRESGHAGTLDPGADGVLLLCFGRATKLTERLMDQPKVYRAAARLDVTSESFDSDRRLIDVQVDSIPDEAAVRSALEQFEGLIQQVPPAVSAVKVDGQRAYKLQRAGQSPILRARSARIYWLVLHRYQWPILDFEMACGRGTYVRALIRDLGQALGTGGCLTALTRTQIGPFHLNDAVTCQTLAQAENPLDHLIDLPQARSMLSADPPVVPNRPPG